jgi:hypothetical protein
MLGASAYAAPPASLIAVARGSKLFKLEKSV